MSIIIIIILLSNFVDGLLRRYFEFERKAKVVGCCTQKHNQPLKIDNLLTPDIKHDQQQPQDCWFIEKALDTFAIHFM